MLNYKSMRKWPNGMAQASQACGCGFKSRLSLHHLTLWVIFLFDNKLVNRKIRDLNGTLKKVASGKFLV